jgi:toxin YoeB
MHKNFHDQAWGDYLGWHESDKAKWKRVNEILKSIERTPFEGIGKPEPLKYRLSGWWSRRITDEHRLVYRISRTAGGEQQIEILYCQGHHE